MKGIVSSLPGGDWGLNPYKEMTEWQERLSYL